MNFRRIIGPFAAACLLGMTPYTTSAQADSANKTDALQSTVQYEIELGAGAVVKPKYPSADSFLVSTFPIFGVGRFYVPGLGQVVDGEVAKQGFFFYPSFDVNGERKASDSSDLTGTRTICSPSAPMGQIRLIV